MTSRPSTAAPILAVLAIVLVTLGAYVGGYFWLGQRVDGQSVAVSSTVERRFAYGWQVRLYSPVGYVESKTKGVSVILGTANFRHLIESDGDP